MLLKIATCFCETYVTHKIQPPQTEYSHIEIFKIIFSVIDVVKNKDSTHLYTRYDFFIRKSHCPFKRKVVFIFHLQPYVTDKFVNRVN